MRLEESAVEIEEKIEALQNEEVLMDLGTLKALEKS